MKFRLDVLIASGLFLLSLAINFYKIEQLPPGMYGDETTLGRKALTLVNSGTITPFLSQYSHPTPLLYLAGFSINLFGHTVTAIRLPMVVIGALSIMAFYFLLRLFLNKFLATGGSILLACSYTFIVLNRLAYEPPASTLCQILFFLFLLSFLKTKTQNYLIFSGLALGVGLYTYLNFRLFFLAAIIASLILLEKKVKLLTKVFVPAIIVALPLIIFAFFDPHGFFLRSAEVSVFGRGLSQTEVVKELFGSTTRTLGGFGLVGDPNPGKNPAGFPIFDPFTSLLFLAGVVVLFKTQRKLFWAMTAIFIAALFSDIFSIEQIPEFHYYGLGHPNALRVSGLIFPIIFCAIMALAEIKHNHSKYIVGLVIIFISGLNLFTYFNQINLKPEWYVYNFQVNRTSVLNMITFINDHNFNQVVAPKDFVDGEQKDFFLAKNISMLPITQDADLATVIQTSPATLLQVTKTNLDMIKTAAQTVKNNPLIRLEVFNDPLGNTEGVIFYRY